MELDWGTLCWVLFFGALIGFAIGVFVYHMVGKVYEPDDGCTMHVSWKEAHALRAIRRMKEQRWKHHLSDVIEVEDQPRQRKPHIAEW